jgi:hypothetical protein
MADVYTVTFILIGMLICLPALLVALNLLLPAVTKRIETRLSEKPGRSFVIGVPVTAVLILWVLITAEAGAGVIRGTAFITAAFGMALGTLGAAGMARVIGKRITPLAQPNSTMTNLVRGAVVYELACLFPIVGWFVFAPLIGVTVMGAAVTSLFRRKPNVSEQVNVVETA